MNTMGFRILSLLCAVLLTAACTSPASDAPDVAPAAENAPAAAGGGAMDADHNAWSLSTSIDDQGRLVAEVKAKPGYHINEAYPWKLAIGALELRKDQAANFTQKDARFVTSVDADPGQKVDGQLRFSVCNDQHCLTPQADLHWNIH